MTNEMKLLVFLWNGHKTRNIEGKKNESPRICKVRGGHNSLLRQVPIAAAWIETALIASPR